MGAYTGLSKYFSTGIVEKANELGYGEFLISILKGDIETLEHKYNSVWNTLKSCKYHIEDKDPIEFGRNMIATWMLEDCVLGALKKNGIDITYGKDYITRKRFTTNPDKIDSNIIINTPNKSFSLFIRCDYTGSWTREGTLILRESQYKRIKDKKMILMGLSTVDNKLILLNHTSLKNVTRIESYERYYGKPVYELSIPESAISTFTIPNMVSEIKNYCLYK